MEKPKIVFMGTPNFAVPSLRILIERHEQIVTVVTQPDRPSGRGRNVKYPPIKEVAIHAALPVLQPENVCNEQFQRQLKDLSPDLITVVAFGQILPPSVLAVPPGGCINIHASLLPAYRGAAPINWAIIRGETKTGITVMQVDEGLDTGDILLQESIDITPEDNALTLHDRLAELGAKLLARVLDQYKKGALQPVPQDHSQASYAPALKKEDGLINWEKSALEIYRQVRGMTPWPGCFTYMNGKLLKVFSVRPTEKNPQAVPGEILSISPEGIEVATGKGTMVLIELQLEGKKKMTATQFIRGYRLQAGTILKCSPN